jgi:hypothetical protein
MIYISSISLSETSVTQNFLFESAKIPQFFYVRMQCTHLFPLFSTSKSWMLHFRTLSPFYTLTILRRIWSFCMIRSLYCIFVFLTRGVVDVIYMFLVGYIETCCNVTIGDQLFHRHRMYVSTCISCWWTVSKSIS